jgi:hypothetical protein
MMTTSQTATVEGTEDSLPWLMPTRIIKEKGKSSLFRWSD